MQIGEISVRISNSGSRYEPFNQSFMIMFFELQKTDDILDFNHQMHKEEYLYIKRKKTH